MTAIRNEIEARLTRAFKPSALEVLDESHLHQGHVGARPEGETHFRVIIKTDHFSGQSRLAMHRAINAELADLMDNPIHALAINASV